MFLYFAILYLSRCWIFMNSIWRLVHSKVNMITEHDIKSGTRCFVQYHVGHYRPMR
jgi:hypothetical protein